MANDIKNALLAVKNGEQIQKIFVQTSAQNVIVNKATGETLKQRLAAITKQLGSADLSVTEQIDEVKTQIQEIIGTAPESLDSIHEIAGWIEGHAEEFEALKTVADGIDAAIAEVVGDIGEYETVAAFVEAKIEAAKAAEEARCAAAVAAEAAAREAADDALATAIGEAQAAIEAEVTRAQEAEEELAKAIEDSFVVFESADEFDPEKVKAFACILLDDDPEEIETAEQLVSALLDAESTAPVVLQDNIAVTAELAAVLANLPDGKVIDLNGFALEG